MLEQNSKFSSIAEHEIRKPEDLRESVIFFMTKADNIGWSALLLLFYRCAMFSLAIDNSFLISCSLKSLWLIFSLFPHPTEEAKFLATKQLASLAQRDSCHGERAIMPKKRSTQSGSNSATAKLISRINKFGQNSINNSDSDQANESYQRNHFGYDDDDDEVFVLSAKQKQQLQRNEYLESLTKEQLKIEAKRRSQKTAGTKTELVDSPTLLHLAVFLCALICKIGTSTFFRLLFFSICRSTFCCNSHRFLRNFFFHFEWRRRQHQHDRVWITFHVSIPSQQLFFSHTLLRRSTCVFSLHSSHLRSRW